ncbi:MAG TPA: hypothetical protein VFA85_18865 [Terriglobales bacterium]|nr:hypothetical protein [Terriglobales bacterium]
MPVQTNWTCREDELLNAAVEKIIKGADWTADYVTAMGDIESYHFSFSQRPQPYSKI